MRPKSLSNFWGAYQVYLFFCGAEKRIFAFSGSFSRKVRISLRSVTHTSTYRRVLISSLQGITNALLNGQLVPLDNYQLSILPNEETELFVRKAKRSLPQNGSSHTKLFFVFGHVHAYLSAFTYLAPARRYQRLA